MTATSVRARCRVCASERSERAFAEPSPLERCLDCGFVYTASAPHRLEADVYDEDYFVAGGYRSYFARASQWRHEARLRLRWLLAVARPERLLEVGCAGGFFVEQARRAGIDAVGVELSAVPARYACTELGVPVTVGAFEDVELAGRFDAVCAFHVLEHVLDPGRFLEKARAQVRPGGWLALEVPNIDSARARREGASWFGLEPEYHLWHFGPTTLARLVRDAGFVPERGDTVFAHHYSPPRELGGPFALASFAASLRAARSLHGVHPSHGDYVRLIARRP